MFDRRESEKLELTPELAAIERQLVGLNLSPAQVDRDRLMFAAGRAAERAGSKERRARSRIGWFWPAATATMTAATVMLAAMLVWRERAPSPSQQAAMPPAPVQADMPRETNAHHVDRWAPYVDAWSMAPPVASGYLGVRYIALTRGVGASEPVFQPASGNGESTDRERSQPATARSLLDELLPIATETIPTRS